MKMLLNVIHFILPARIAEPQPSGFSIFLIKNLNLENLDSPPGVSFGSGKPALHPIP